MQTVRKVRKLMQYLFGCAVTIKQHAAAKLGKGLPKIAETLENTGEIIVILKGAACHKTLKPSRFQGFFFAYRTHFCTHFGIRNRIAATENTAVSRSQRHRAKQSSDFSIAKPI
ncbi:MAG: hypothetical protein ACLUFI_15175 [Oscillospiraceae bacterium]